MNKRLYVVAITLLSGCPTNSAENDAGVSADTPSADAAVSADAPTARRDDIAESFAIAASQQATGGGALQRNLAALFSENPCSVATVGPCVLTTCPTPPNDGGLPPGTNLGVITVSGGQLTAPVTLVPNATTGAYRPMLNVNGPFFAPGDTVTFGTERGEMSTNLTAPSTITVTAPMLTDEMVVDRGSDLAFTWTTAEAAPTGDVVVSGLSFGSGPGAGFIDCSFPVSAGSGVVPAAALQAVQAGSANIRVSTRSAAVIDVDGVRTEIELRNDVGGVPGVNVRLQ